MLKQVASVIAAGLAAGVFAQSSVLYAPVRTLADQSIKLRGWGSGSINETDELAFEGGRSIRVSTQNFFQGGYMSIGNPVDLSAAYADKNNLLRLIIRVADMSITFSSGGGGAGGGATGGGPAGVGGPGGGRPGQGNPGTPGGTGQKVESTLKNIRLIFATTDGKKSEAYIPISTGAGGERGWRFVAVPLQAVAGLGETNKIISEIGISGDAISTFYVGDMRIINDTTPITGDLNYHQLNLALGDEVEFVGRGFGGSSVLEYAWDFNSADGIQVDAVGQSVKRKFRKPGKYTVTLAVRDVFGLKKPYTTTCSVTVNP